MDRTALGCDPRARWHLERLGVTQDRHVAFRAALIAAGAEPTRLAIPGEQHLIDNEGFLELETLPKRIVLVGGGYIAAEFSHIAARAGAKVTIIQHGERMLNHFDPDLVGWLMDKFRGLGIDVRTEAKVTSIEKTEDGCTAEQPKTTMFAYPTGATDIGSML